MCSRRVLPKYRCGRASGGSSARPEGIASSNTRVEDLPMKPQPLTPAQMQARVARFKELATYQQQNFEAHQIPPGAVEKVAARRVYPVMVPADYQGRSAGAPIKGPRGLIISIAECEPG